MDSKLITTKDGQSFFRLHDSFSTRRYRLGIQTKESWLNLNNAHALARARFLPPTPIKMMVEMGGETADFLWTNFPPLICISEKLINILLENKLNGWATYDVEILKKDSEQLLGYKGFAISGKECRRDRSRGERITKPAKNGRKESDVLKGLFFMKEDWDGSDFFWIDTGSRIVTERVKELFMKKKISNIVLTVLDEVERDAFLEKY